MEEPVLMADPSFREIIAVHQHTYQISTVHSPYHYDEGFEFTFVLQGDPADTRSGNKAYPVFGRSLPHHDALSLPLEKPFVEASSLENGELEGLAEGSYCPLALRSVPPSPERCRKSSSTGSLGLRCRLRDLVWGRSRSDGKEKFAFLGSPEKANSWDSKPEKKKKKKGSKVTAADAVTIHRTYYTKSNVPKAGRQSFLPYRPVLLGLFSNRHPF